jgi:hypothetical protein
MPRLQQCVYFLSLAIKDREVIQWLARIGLSFSQVALLRHLLSETEDERQAWEVIRDSGALHKIAWAAFLKVLLPVETLAATQTGEAQNLRKEWDEAYGWLLERERENLLDFTRRLMGLEGKTFQEKLERATFLLIGTDL